MSEKSPGRGRIAVATAVGLILSLGACESDSGNKAASKAKDPGESVLVNEDVPEQVRGRGAGACENIFKENWAEAEEQGWRHLEDYEVGQFGDPDNDIMGLTNRIEELTEYFGEGCSVVTGSEFDEAAGEPSVTAQEFVDSRGGTIGIYIKTPAGGNQPDAAQPVESMPSTTG